MRRRDRGLIGNRTTARFVCAAMDMIRRSALVGVALLTLVFALSACAAGAASPNPSQPPSDAPITAPPSDGTGGEPSPDPVIGAKPIVPKPGQLDVHQVPADSLAARVDGNTVVVTAAWTSGVEPCNILDHVEVIRGDGTLSIALYEGHGPGEVVCIAIAEEHMTEIEIPDVAAGTWSIVDASGNAPPVEVTVG